MKVLIPLSGPTPYFPPEEYPYPKALVDVLGRPMITRVTENLASLAPDVRFVFVVNKDEAVRYSYENIFRFATNGQSETISLVRPTAGALCSCLMAISHIDPDSPLVIANGDQIIDQDLSQVITFFEQRRADAGVVTFEAIHPRWSYARVESDGTVIETSEKQVISRSAIAGLYYFKRGSDFVNAAFQSLVADEAVNGSFFIAPILNHLIIDQKKVISFEIDRDTYHSFYLPSGIQRYEQLCIAGSACGERVQASRINIVIPAAGKGSRFVEAGWRAPKPFIDVMGRPMLEHVVENVMMSNAQPICLIQDHHLRSHSETIESLRKTGVAWIEVSGVTEGTACTVLLARSEIDSADPLLIVNSDQLVEFDCSAFVEDAKRRKLDGSILVFRDLTRNPKWSFAALGSTGLVTEVAEKRPISDLATVGIYYFAKGEDFVRSAIDMIARNEKVNNEFYTCPVYNYMIRSGLRVGIYEVEPDCMSALGTPVDLEAFLLKQNAPKSIHAPGGA